MSFILASSSIRRQQLLKYLISNFEIIAADINEDELAKLARTPQEMVVNLAKAKVKKVWEKINEDTLIQDNLSILGADTTVILPNGDSWVSLGKPTDEKDAKKMLQTLRGTQHHVYTGICLLNTNKDTATFPTILTDYDLSTVSFGDFSDEMIDTYIATGKVMDKAGAYAIQDIGKQFRITVEGSYSNVVGLPMEILIKHFDKIGIEYQKNWQQYLKI